MNLFNVTPQQNLYNYKSLVEDSILLENVVLLPQHQQTEKSNWTQA